MKMSCISPFPRIWFLVVLACGLLLASCEKKKTGSVGLTGKKEDLSGLIYEDIPGSTVKYARQMNASGGVEIEGYMQDNKKTGMWVQYSENGDIAVINHYVDGLLEGVALRMTYRNQVDLKSTYRKGQLNGPWASYKFGKLVEERTYKDGQLEGTVKTYDDRTFKLKQEVQYKNGVQDGYFRYYDEEGNLTLEYQYKKGEKVSGGLVKK